MDNTVSMPRTLFSADHDQFRSTVRRFCEEQIVPRHEEWSEAHQVPRDVWLRAGELGMLCAWVPEAYGGLGTDILFDVIVSEELGRVGATGPGFPLHSLIVAPYIVDLASEDVRQRVLPGMVSGEKIGAIVMTEPGAGSDLASIRTSAVRDGNGWRINGQKTFITNGRNADVMVVACVTDPSRGAKGISLFVIEAGCKGFSRGRNLRKIGQHAQDTAELFFDNVYVEADSLLGEPGRGFAYMMQKLAQERLLVSVQCQSRAEGAFDATVAYVTDRKAFGKRVLDFQNTRFKLADLKAQLMAGRAFCDRLLELQLEQRLDAVQAAAGKLWHSELLGRVVDECLQLHGGYGYMAEYPIGRAFVDARIERIYGGTSEIMKEVVGRSIGSS
jgi:acyl-CoA dehydrogenase